MGMISGILGKCSGDRQNVVPVTDRLDSKLARQLYNWSGFLSNFDMVFL